MQSWIQAMLFLSCCTYSYLSPVIECTLLKWFVLVKAGFSILGCWLFDLGRSSKRKKNGPWKVHEWYIFKPLTECIFTSVAGLHLMLKWICQAASHFLWIVWLVGWLNFLSLKRYWQGLRSQEVGEEGDCTQCYAVTTRMTSAVRWAAMRAILMFRQLWWTVTRLSLQATILENRGEWNQTNLHLLTSLTTCC